MAASTELAVSGNGGQTPATSANGDQIEENQSSPLSSVGNVDVLRQISLVLALAISLALAVLVMLWAQEPNYRPIAEMETAELVETLDFLDKQQIDYKLQGNVLSFPEEDIADIKLQLTRAGLGPGRQQQDFLNQDSGFGVSQRLEQARLKKSQEESLASAISELRSVNRARVILALPKHNVFARKRQQPSATVVVTLGRGTELKQSEVDAIVDIVGSAVHGLQTEKVTVTDQHGRLLHSGSQNSVTAQGRRELELQIKQEQLYLNKIDSLLIPVLGLGQFTAQVAVDMDFSANEKTTRSYAPDTVIRSEMLIEDNQNGKGSMGIPGALTNQPPLESDIPQQVNGAAQTESVANGRSRSEATRNYELDSTISHTRSQIGTVQRVTMSVAVDYRPSTAADGSVTMEPRSEAELKAIERLLAGSIGFDGSRGDVLEVVSVPFAQELMPELEEATLVEQPWFWRAVRLTLGGIVLLVLLLVVVRPMVKKLLFPEQVQAEIEQANAGNELADLEDQFSTDIIGGAGNDASDYGYADDGSIMLPDLRKDDDMLRAIRALVANEPELSTRVIKSWLEDDA
ncbi:flagellar basal-body MS-ring/collar protein FliF [Ferrimonas lipolytica]|uniref:Flagellar M-ring protein n=1 Tax=Ferrimonas lipolytica TaxID=2724191 RepID=A0A6H1UGL6_9GAMM|nr:flagellar basal-body MS-ring/collar protein FliF [Ferrimonas lipolytica]QIZ77356.1 flagellar M-ring protein FliF [Ferrimonas lipolytica]